MTIHEYLSEYGGLPVFDFAREEERPEAGAAAWRIATEFEGEHFGEVFARFLREVETTRVTALVIGYWGASYDDNTADPVELLVPAADRFPALRSLFLGDIVMEESEISWIEHSDITPLLEAFPLLERFEVRGGTGLRLNPVKSTALRVLRMETGGLPREVVRGVGECDLPNLERLDLWLGVPDYGGNATAADLAPILGGERLPALRHLALADAGIQDEVAAAVAGAPVVARLETLDLSMGALTDEGAEALLSGQPLTHLKRLDLSHHYLSEEMMRRVRAALPGVEIDLSDRQDQRGRWRFVAVSE
ncbi:leucine-rich repeat domain-containing protein [Actinomadura craniellae]|uniref:Leucine-rich repeat domain-containing protein n=1 Tax=Actinomadura craniellae TaxID=2231787 RepID=A0A365GVR8_9ACTN|nr:STM4015 family protein [Actinomadura craniellae]RAY10882.1 leucine-rich repeat domain-containing protein [Actinomadura craniellae]